MQAVDSAVGGLGGRPVGEEYSGVVRRQGGPSPSSPYGLSRQWRTWGFHVHLIPRVLTRSFK